MHVGFVTHITLALVSELQFLKYQSLFADLLAEIPAKQNFVVGATP